MPDERKLNTEIFESFQRAERTGLRLAIKGRLVAIVLLLLWLIWSRGHIAAFEFLIVGGVFAAMGLLHYHIISTRWDRPWVKYIFLGIDVALLSVLVAVAPVHLQVELPQSLIFRFDIFPYYFLFIAAAGFSFSPWLVLWAGVAGSVSWLMAYLYIFATSSNPLQWEDIPNEPTLEQFMAIFLSPDFLPYGSRIQEIVVLLLTAILLTVVIHRARGTVYAHLKADAERRSVSDMFGRHVPKAVADRMILNKGALQPVEREATVMFVDIAGFTTLTEKLGPSRITNVLNAYFDDATIIISNHGGVVTQFLGDAILAIFNVPVVDPDHPQKALDAAKDLIKQVKMNTYGGETLSVRIGINTGNLVAGNIGGGGRHTYTVYGDAVNLAARLEPMNKKFGTQILLSGSTANQVANCQLRNMGFVNIQGQSEQSEVFTIQEK